VSSPLAREPTLADVQREFPSWECWRGVSGLYHARPCDAATDAATLVTGEDPMDLRNQIRRAEALRDQ
jgi:hypothetical protein